MPRHLITAALPGADGVGSLGALAGSVLPADVYARFLRARGERVLFVSASDEPCLQRHEAQAQLAEQLGLSFDAFGRSSAARTREQTHYFAQRLEEEGFLEPRSTRQVLSRETRDSRHLFLLQSKLVGELREWLGGKSDWPPLARSPGLEWLDEGLGDRSVTEDLVWGVPVERQGFEEKVYGAWFAAPIAYIGTTREWAEASGEPDAWREWWRASDEVRYVQFMVGDDVPDHTVCFPCAVLGSRERWKLVDYLKAFHRLSCSGDASQALELLPADCWRYYLTANAPETEDADFSWEALAIAVNDELAGIFGDFVHLSLGLAERHFGGEVPAGGEPGPPELELLEDLDLRLDAYTERMAALELRAAIGELRAIWRRGRAYLDSKQPGSAIEADRADAELTLRFCLNLVCLFARLGAPAMPSTSERILDALGVPETDRGWPSAFKGDELAPGHRFTAPSLPFRRVAGDDVERWRTRFGSGRG